MNSLSIKNLSLHYGTKLVIKKVDLKMATRELGCLLGQSGCGKSTLLLAIAGFQTVSGGEIQLSGRTLSTSHQNVAPEKRNIGMVFQDIALFPHLTVEDNIQFGLQNYPAVERSVRVSELLELIGLTDLKKRFPFELSGGQQQRVALARAMAPRPELLLLDEPFSGLDTELRGRLAGEVRRILKYEGISALLVTHDQREAFDFADRLAVMDEGRIVQWDSPYTIFHEPKSRFVAHFMGAGQLVDAIVNGRRTVDCPLGQLTNDQDLGMTIGTKVQLFLRPDDIIYDENSDYIVTIVGKQFRGAQYLYTVRLANGYVLGCFAPSHRNHNIGESIGVSLDLTHLVVFPIEAGDRER